MTKSISRFGRDTVEMISNLRELNRLGINVIFENDNVDTVTEDSEMVITIISAVAQAENESRRKNIQWGMAKRAEDRTSGFYRRRCYGMNMMKMESRRSSLRRPRSSVMYMLPISMGEVSTRLPGN